MNNTELYAELVAAIKTKDADAVEKIIRLDPQASSDELIKLAHVTRGSISRLRQDRKELLAASYRNEMTRAEYWDRDAKLEAKIRGAEGYVKVVSRYTQLAQRIGGDIRRLEKGDSHRLREAIREHYLDARMEGVEITERDRILWAAVGIKAKD